MESTQVDTSFKFSAALPFPVVVTGKSQWIFCLTGLIQLIMLLAWIPGYVYGSMLVASGLIFMMYFAVSASLCAGGTQLDRATEYFKQWLKQFEEGQPLSAEKFKLDNKLNEEEFTAMLRQINVCACMHWTEGLLALCIGLLIVFGTWSAMCAGLLLGIFQNFGYIVFTLVFLGFMSKTTESYSWLNRLLNFHTAFQQTMFAYKFYLDSELKRVTTHLETSFVEPKEFIRISEIKSTLERKLQPFDTYLVKQGLQAAYQTYFDTQRQQALS